MKLTLENLEMGVTGLVFFYESESNPWQWTNMRLVFDIEWNKSSLTHVCVCL